MDEYRLRIGNVVLSLLFENSRECRSFGAYFRRQSTPDPADIQLAVRYRDDAPRRAVVPSSLFLTKTGGGEGFSVAGGLIMGRYSTDRGEGELTVQRLLLKGEYARIFEQILYQAYWSAVRRKGVNSFLLHSSGVIRGGLGYAFTGKSGSGKSTVAKLSLRDLVVNDEITAIDLSESTPVIRDTPFNGFFKNKKEGSAKLAGILILTKALQHRITRISDIEHLKALAAEVIPPIGLETPFSPSVFIDMLCCAEQVRAMVPLYRMEFMPDRGFWDKIDLLIGG